MYLISNLAEDLYIQLLNTEDAVVDGNYPASTNYIDVSGFEKFGFLIGLGAVDSAMAFQVKQDTAATETASIKNVTGATFTFGTSGATGDDHWACIEVETRKLDISNDFHFVTLAESGATGNDYACIWFYGVPAVKPCTQSSTKATSGSVIVAG